ncbi:MAG TPA: hypothetical protein VFQ27_14070 [Xanthobacteraceae bacterium]|jgi:hypothetical protein|nr:hypothetical protein [Xanthobacteraceae bacterium]
MPDAASQAERQRNQLRFQADGRPGSRIFDPGEAWPDEGERYFDEIPM